MIYVSTGRLFKPIHRRKGENWHVDRNKHVDQTGLLEQYMLAVSQRSKKLMKNILLHNSDSWCWIAERNSRTLDMW